MSNELGRLYYTLGIDDAEFGKKMNAAKEMARAIDGDIQKRLNFKIHIDSNLSSDAIRAVAELTKQTNAKANADSKAALAAQRLSSVTLNQAKTDEVRARTTERSAIAAQKQATEAERTALAHVRLENATKRAAAAQDGLKNRAEFVNKTFTNQRVIAYQLANVLGTTFSVYAIGAFVNKLAQVRGEFELQQVAIRAIIRDKQAADRIFSQVKSLAVESPFQFKELVGYTKQLAAFSIETDKLFDTTKRLADVSSGLGVDMGRIVLAYGQVKAATVLRGQELRQFTEAGIPLVDKLAEKFSKLENKTVSAGDVFERISNRMVSFKDVDEIFKDLTSSGGMFFDMQKKQADTLYGKMSNLKDAYELMLNDIGQANEGLLKGGVNAISALIRNWSTIASVLKVVIAAYGAYRVCILAAAVQERIHVALLSRAIQIQTASAAAGAMLGDAQAMAAAKTSLLTASFTKLKAAMLANPVTAIITGLVTLGAVVYEVGNKYEWFASAAEKGASSAKRLQESADQMMSSKVDRLVDTYEHLAGKINRSASENKLFKETIAEIGREVPNAITKLDAYGNAAEVNMRKVTSRSKAERDAIRENTYANLQDARQKYAQLRNEEAMLLNDLKRNIKTVVTAGGETFERSLTLKEKNKIIGDLNEVRASYNSLASAILNAKKALGFGDLIPKAPARLGESIQNLSTAISKLKPFSGVRDEAKKYVESVTDMGTATEGLMERYNQAKADYERMTSAKGIYANGEVQRVKNEYALYKTIKEQILGIKDKANAKAAKEAEDKYATALKNRIDLIKQAKQQYEELNKAYGKTTAASIVKGRYSKELPNLQLEGDKYKAQFTKALDDLRKHSSKQATALKHSITKDIKDIEQKGMIDPFDKALENFQRFVDENKNKFDVYQKVFDITGDEKRAIKIGFGIDAEGLDAIQILKDNIVNEVKRLQSTGDFKFDFDINYENLVKNINSLPEKVKPEIEHIQNFISEGIEQAMLDEERMRKELEDYNAQRASIDRKYDSIILKARQEHDDRLIKEAIKHKNDEIKELDKSYVEKFAMETGFFERLFANARSISKKTLEVNMANMKKLSAYITGMSKELPSGITADIADKLKNDNALLKDLYDNMNKLQEYADKKKDPFSQIFSGLKGFSEARKLLSEANTTTDKAIKEQKTDQALFQKERGMKALASGATMAAETVGYLSDAMTRLAEASGDEKLKESAVMLASWSSTLGATAQGFASGGPWGGLISGVSNMIGQIGDAFAQEAAQEASLKQSRTDFVNKMKLMDLELKSTDYESVFGVKSIGKAAEAYKLAQKALEEYDAAVNKKMERPDKQKEYKNVGAVVYGGFLGGTHKELTNEFKTLMAAYKKGYTELQGMAVKTKDRSGFANFWGKKDQFKALKDYAPELWGRDGVFSVEKAKAFLATDSKINDAQKKQIQNVIDLKEAYDKNMEVVREDIANTFGTLGTAITDSLADSIMNGVDAWDAFTKAGSTSLETIGKKMAYELFFSKKFSNLQKQLEDTYGITDAEAMASQQMAILSEFFSNIKTDMTNAQAWMEEWKKKGAEAGFDLWGGTTGGGLQGEIKGIKEDTAQLLASLLNAVRSDVSLSNIHLTDIKGILSNTQSSIASSLSYLASIDANTYNLLMAFKSVVGGKGSVGDGIRVWA